MNENLQENVQQPQEPKNDNGKRLFYVLLVVLAWICFMFGLVFGTSKCSKAYKFPNSDISYNENQTLMYTAIMDSYYCHMGSSTNGDISTAPNINAYHFTLTCNSVNYGSLEYYVNGSINNDLNVITFTNRYSLGNTQTGSVNSSSISYTFTINSDTASFNQGFFSYNVSVASPTGGYTQADIDNAYEQGQVDMINEFSSSDYGTGHVYTEIVTGDVDTEISHIYGEGELQALNIASGSSHGSGTTYTSYTNSSMIYEMDTSYNTGYSSGQVDGYNVGYTSGYNVGSIDGYSSGQVDVLNYLSSTYGDSFSYSIYNTTYVDDEVSYIVNDSKLSVLNVGVDLWNSLFSDDLLGYYTSPYSDSTAETLFNLFYSKGRLIGKDNGMLELLNYASSQNGSGIVYSTYTYSDYDNELALIYSNGAAGTGSNVGYSGGYTAGVNSVLDNLSNYELYSRTAYESYGNTRYASGYSAGYTAGNQNEDNSLPKVIVSIASVPYTVLTSMFNFNVLNLNIFLFVTSLISLAVVIWLIKKIWK